MFKALCLLLLFTQAVLGPKTGKVSGSLQMESGLPASGFRVGAKPADPEGGDTLYGLTAADSAGRFVLDNIPPGRYYIIAGSIDRPTFYPGTEDTAKALVVSVGPDETVAGIDFPLLKASATRTEPQTTAPPQKSRVTLPIDVVVEGGGDLPTALGASEIHFTNKQGGAIASVPPLAGSNLSVSLEPGEYRFQVLNLPPGYVVKSAMYQSKDLTKDSYSLTLTPAGAALNISTFSGQGPLQDAVDRAAQEAAQALNRLIVTIAPAQ